MRHQSNCSVIIPTMNRPDSLRRTISKISQSSTLPAEIIVIDQTQNLNLRNQIQELVAQACKNGLHCRYYFQDEPSSTKARNEGIRQATEDILVFSDDDVDVEIHTFEDIERIFDDPKIALIAGLDSNMKFGAGNPIGYFMGTKSWGKRRIGHVTLSMLGRFPVSVQKDVDTEWAMGYFFAVRRPLVYQWDLWFDENLTSYAYAEDLDFSLTYCKKAKERGLRCIFSPKIVVDHLGSKEYRVPSQKSIFMYVINREYLSYKHKKSPLSRIAMRWTNFCMYLMNINRPTTARYYKQAQARCNQNRNKLKCGIIPNDIYDDTN